MKDIENKIIQHIKIALSELYQVENSEIPVQIQKTRKDIKGDYTITTFNFSKYSRKAPEVTASEIGDFLRKTMAEIENYQVIKGFLNIEISNRNWIIFLKEFQVTPSKSEVPKQIMIEFSSPNTNKPLHLGHIRNNLIGDSISRILKAVGHNVLKVNLINDRGIHICKSMLAKVKWFNDDEPAKSGQKGDKFVGDLYVRFDREYKSELALLTAKGLSPEEAEKESVLMKQAREMLKKWEDGDNDIRALWTTMNNWVYNGFELTYKNLGIEFDKIYFESQTYLLGKEIVDRGLQMGIFKKHEDGSVWIDLTSDGLDEKLLLRSDGTSVYITQDIGTAVKRFEEYDLDKLIYVVGNEQNYHFQVLKIIMKKLGYLWYDQLCHLSYGMVELPTGKMKSREGKVVDADDLIQVMIETARKTSEQLGKLDGFSDVQTKTLFHQLAMGALKYFILKVDPKKNMLFNPEESIDFNGNTGPFVQYTFARTQSVLRKASDNNIHLDDIPFDDATILNEKELNLIKELMQFHQVLSEAAERLDPSLVACFTYDLAKEYNQFYHDFSILKEPDINIRNLRLMLTLKVGQTIRYGLNLLGIEAPERM